MFQPSITTEYEISPAANDNICMRSYYSILGNTPPSLNFQDQKDPQRIVITFDQHNKTSMIFTEIKDKVVCLSPNKIVNGSYLSFKEPTQSKGEKWYI